MYLSEFRLRRDVTISICVFVDLSLKYTLIDEFIIGRFISSIVYEIELSVLRKRRLDY